MRPVLALALLFAPTLAWGGCDEGVSVDAFEQTADGALRAFGKEGEGALNAHFKRLAADLKCVAEPLTPGAAARYHRLVAILSWTGEKPERARLAAQAAAALDPGYTAPGYVLDEGDPLREVLEAPASEVSSVDVPVGDGLVLLIDGRERSRRPEGRPFVAQLVQDGRVVWNRYLPPTGKVPLSVDLDEAPPRLPEPVDDSDWDDLDAIGGSDADADADSDWDDATPSGPDLGPGDTAAIGFTKLIIRDDEGTIRAAAAGELRIMLLEHLRKLGFDAKGAENTLFDQDASGDARFFLGGTVEEVQYVDGVHDHELEVTVEWQVFDAANDVVVYTGTSRGHATDDRDQEIDRLIHRSLKRAVENVSERDSFLRTIAGNGGSEPNWEAKPSWSGPLMVKTCGSPSVVLPAGLESAMDAAVVIKAGQGTGSGVLISEDGFVITAAHVVADQDDIEASTRDHLTLPAQVVRIDEVQDVAVLKMAGSGHPCRPLARGDAGIGTELYTVGAPAGTDLEFSVSKGIVSGLRSFHGNRYLQTDASINFGNSGGPLLDGQGAILGVVSWKIAAPGFEGLGFGVPTDALVERLDLEFGTASSDDLDALRGEVGAGLDQVAGVQDSHVEASKMKLQPRRAQSAAASNQLGYYNTKSFGDAPMTYSGTILATTGLAMVGITWGLHLAANDATGTPMTRDEWYANRGVNTAGWVLTLGGGTLLGAGLVKEF